MMKEGLRILRSATVRVSLQLPRQLDAQRMIDYAATKGLITFKVYPRESGFDIISPEPGLVAVRGFEDEVEYKLYMSNDASAVTIIMYFNKGIMPAKYLAELMELLRAGGASERDVLSAEASAVIYEDRSLPTFMSSKKEYLGNVKVKGLAMYIDDGMVVLTPVNDNSDRTIVTIVLKGPWSDVKRRVLVLDSLVEEAFEVVDEWSSQK